MPTPSIFFDAIRARVPIEAVIGRSVSLRRDRSSPKRGDYWGLCPFCRSTTASLFTHARPEGGFFHCFHCGERGDVIRFVEKHQKVSFRQAAIVLAVEAGVPLPLGPNANAG